MKRRIDISDHAVLRWLERVEGVNTARIRRRIVKSVKLAVEHEAAGTTVDGVNYKISYQRSGRAVITTAFCATAKPHLATGRDCVCDEDGPDDT